MGLYSIKEGAYDAAWLRRLPLFEMPVSRERIEKLKPRAFSLLELIVTLAVMTFIITAVLELLSQMRYQMDYLHQDLARRARLQHSLDKLMDDLVMGSKEEVHIKINKDIYNGLETAWLELRSGGVGGRGGQIDWVAVPRTDEDDLVLFRRKQPLGTKEKALYVPQCANLFAFDVNMLDPNGNPGGDPNESTLIEVWAQMYRMGDRDPDRVISVKRTFSLHRFHR